MAQHLRFKRHLRFLQQEGIVRVVTDLEANAELPAGEAFDHLLAVLAQNPVEQSARTDLQQRMSIGAEMVDALLDRLFTLGLIERFDPDEQRHARFDRQLLLLDAIAPVEDHAEVIARQDRLAHAQVLILGMGGIGHQIALSLAAAGVGTLILVDGDTVEASNLHRQILFASTDVERYKVDAARDGLARVAPQCDVVRVIRHVANADDWRELIQRFPEVRHVVLSADRPVTLANWISDARKAFNYHFIKCGYMTTQGLIGPLLGPDTLGYDELFNSWGPMIDAQPSALAAFNARSIAPTIAASNAIMANFAAFDLIKHITGSDQPTLLGRRLLLDLHTYATSFG